MKDVSLHNEEVEKKRHVQLGLETAEIVWLTMSVRYTSR